MNTYKIACILPHFTLKRRLEEVHLNVQQMKDFNRKYWRT